MAAFFYVGVSAALSLMLALLVLYSLVLSSNRELSSETESTDVDFLFLSVDFLGGSFSSVLSFYLIYSFLSATLWIGVDALSLY